ncbi:MAG TPA: BadF/BadG/BcrA/BcrD ATPase family protein [Pseudonocardiaceae bacterium]|nr:BadF/BadG/BcrA/BcrD ATPase family protein [Pseudonocardiaceae bacterium]
MGDDIVTTTGSAPAAVLAIDGGNSKTDVALVGPDGSLLASARGPGTSVDDRRFETSLVVLDDLVDAVARQAGIDPDGQIAEHTSAFIAGADLPQEEERLEEVLRTRNWSPSLRAGNDTFAVLRAGTQRPWGVGVTCGAGINCVGVAPSGEQTRFLALGRFTGDWGGGLDMGVEVMWWATRAEDGRGEPTALASAVASYFNRDSASDVAIGIHLGDLDADDLIRLTYVLFEVANAGDPVAVRLVDRLAAEISAMALVAMRRLELTGLDTEVVLGGGLLMARNPLLIGGVTERVLAEAPTAQVGVVEVPPIAGAALLGLDVLGLGQEAHDRLREAYAAAGTGAGAAGGAGAGASGGTAAGTAVQAAG